MSSLASSRGWGPGWPDCQRSKMVTIRAGGISLSVRGEVAPIFKGFCDELVQRGFVLDRVADDWGFACRPIRGTEGRANPVPSNHSWGLAVDLNSTENPQGRRATTFPEWAVRLGKEKYGLAWGGDYGSNPDPMHWEFLGTPQQAKQIVAMLAALPADQQPPEPEEDMGLSEVQDQRLVNMEKVGINTEARVGHLEDQLDKLAAKVDRISAGGVDPDVLAGKVADLLAKRLKD